MNAQELRAAEEALYDEWKRLGSWTHKNFVRDGVVNPEVYLSIVKPEPRVLFLLREANWPEDGMNHDMRPYLADGAAVRGVDGSLQKVWRNWQVIARWAKLLRTSDHITWAQIDDEALSVRFRKTELERVAVVNLKKEGGVAAVNWQTLDRYVKACGHLVRRQIDLYRPDIILCGGVASLSEKYVFPHTDREPHRWTSNEVYWFRLTTWPCVVVNVDHFSARRSHEAMFTNLQAAWDEIKRT